MTMPLIDELDARGLVADVTDRAALAELLRDAAPVSAYAGYDPTSPSLHVGNLVPTILLKRLQLAGHRPIVVVGGATGMIGDPSGKSEERNLLDEQTLATNVAGIRAQLARLLDFDDAKTGAVMTNNYDWTRDVGYLAFLRDIGKHLTVNYMMAKDSVRSRLQSENGISFTEFSYMLLQAFDFVQLAKSHGCRLQVGGSDQYGNITAGCELQHKLGGARIFGLSAPLLLDASGQKMGKTATGEKIWLDGERTTPYAFYQYWLNRSDDETSRLLKMFSLQPLEKIDDVLREHDIDRAKRVAQRELARAMTSWVHGDAATARVETASTAIFAGELAKLNEQDLAMLAGTIPTVELARAEIEAGISIVDLLARTVTDSKSEARRLIAGKGVYVNDVAVAEVDRRIGTADLVTASFLVVRKGRRDYRLVRVK
jgi:tyrosyl-tRNA synthetase